MIRNIYFKFGVDTLKGDRGKIFISSFEFFIRSSVNVIKMNTQGSYRNKTFLLINNKMVVSELDPRRSG
jgi:hypothetical protein